MCAKPRNKQTCEAWQLLLRFSFSQRASLPAFAAELELSPAQCHLLSLVAEQPMPMGQLAGALSCDASNVTGRVKVLTLTPPGERLRTALLERMTSSPPTLERLSEADQRALARILRRLLE